MQALIGEIDYCGRVEVEVWWRCNGRVVEAVDEVLWRCNGGVVEVLWRCCGGAMGGLLRCCG